MKAAGVIDAVVAILKADLSHRSVQVNGIACLGNLVRSHNDATAVLIMLILVVASPDVLKIPVYVLSRRLQL